MSENKNDHTNEDVKTYRCVGGVMDGKNVAVKDGKQKHLIVKYLNSDKHIVADVYKYASDNTANYHETITIELNNRATRRKLSKFQHPSQKKRGS